jgi:hypothetical protein
MIVLVSFDLPRSSSLITSKAGKKFINQEKSHDKQLSIMHALFYTRKNAQVVTNLSAADL